MSTAWPVPEIPEDRIIPFDLFDIQPVDGDLHAGWAEWHRRPEIFYTPLNGGHWVLTRAKEIYDVARDFERFSHHGVALFRESHGDRFIPGEIDPPDHAYYRALLNPLLSPARVRVMEERTRALLNSLIDGFIDDGGCEFYSAVAKRMPIYNFLTFINLPLEDADDLLPSVEIIGRGSDPDAFQKALHFMQSYIDARIDERIAEPHDDFISHLIHTEINGRKLTYGEVRRTALNVMLGGLDTVSASMGFFINFLARNPDHRRQLVDDPSLNTEAVEELFRRHAVFNTGRLVKEDLDMNGTRFRKGDLVLLSGALHNLDERRFADPLSVDFGRKDKNHITFGVGIHRCLGSHFARLQLRILLQEWLRRIPDFEIAPGEQIRAKSGRANTVLHLPLSWGAA